MIVVRRVSGSVGDLNLISGAPHGERSALKVDAVAKRRDQPLDIAPGATKYGAPRVLGMQPEKAVIVKKTQQRHRRKLQHALRWRGPHGAAHRQQVVVQEPFAVISGAHIVAQVSRLRI